MKHQMNIIGAALTATLLLIASLIFMMMTHPTMAFGVTVPDSPIEIDLASDSSNASPLDIIIKKDGAYHTNGTNTVRFARSNSDGMYDGYYLFRGSCKNKNITVEPGTKVKIYLDNVSMISEGLTYANDPLPSCIDLSGADITLVLIGTNALSINGGSSEPGVQGAALEKSGMSGSLQMWTIDDGNKSAELSVRAYGDYDVAFGSSAKKAYAGDGGFSNVLISSGLYTFTSANKAPGMGCAFGAYSHSPLNSFSDVTIEHATVTAIGGNYAAGIGSAGTTPVRHVKLSSGAYIRATGGTNSPGIGSGGSANSDQASDSAIALDVSDIEISGGRTDVAATGKNGAGGIGCGLAPEGKSYDRAVHGVITIPMSASQSGSEDAYGVSRSWLGQVVFGASPSNLTKTEENIISLTDETENIAAANAYVRFTYVDGRTAAVMKHSDVNGFDLVRTAALQKMRMNGAMFAVYTDQACSSPYYVIDGGVRKPLTIEIGTDNKGLTTLPLGIYYLRETEAPRNFNVDGQVHKIVVQPDSNPVSVDVTDMPITYKVTFKDYNGTTLSEDIVPQGMAANAPADPSRTGYTFTGWNKDFSTVAENMIVTAEYKILTHKVKFYVATVNSDGNEVKRKLVKTHEVQDRTDAIPPADDAVAELGYEFSGWYGNYTNVTEDRDIIGYNNEKSHVVTFRYGNRAGAGLQDDTIVKTETVLHGKNATPPQEMTNYMGRKFYKWDRSYTNITADTNIYAVYTSTGNYVVTFLVDGITWESRLQSYDDVIEEANFPEVNKEGRNFLGWQNSEQCKPVRNDCTIEGTTEPIMCQVTFKSEGWENDKTQLVEYGQTAQPPKEPTRQGYTFQKWEGTWENVKKDEVVTAVWERNRHTVTFVLDGQVAKVETVMAGDTATPPSPNTHSGYTFSGWKSGWKDWNQNEKIYEDTVVTGSNDINTYTVRFLDWDNSVLKQVDVKYGGSVLPPDNPRAYGRNFLYWGGSYTNVTENRDIPAVYEELAYKVEFVDWDYTLIKEEYVLFGQAATPPVNPVREGYAFSGWNGSFSRITCDTRITAEYIKGMVSIYYSFRTGDDQGGTLSFDHRIIKQGNYITQLNVPTLTIEPAWTLDGWYVNGQKMTPEEIASLAPVADTYVTVQLTRDNAGGGDDADDRDQVIVSYAIRPNDSASIGFTRKILPKNTPIGAENVPSVTLPNGWVLDGYYANNVRYSADEVAAMALTANTSFTIKTFPDIKGNSNTSRPGSYSNKVNVPDGVDDRKQYTVTFLNAVGNVANKQIVTRGGKANEPDSPTKLGCVFSGWDKSMTNVSSDLTLVPLYSSSGSVTPSNPNKKIKPDALLYSGLSKSYKYSGKAICPKPTIKAKVNGVKRTLYRNQDYKLAYANNNAPGTGKIRISLYGKYTGTYYISFKIK